MSIAGEPSRHLWFLDTEVTIRISHLDGGDEISVLEHRAPFGNSAPLHIHWNEDEIFHILEGDMLFRVAEREVSGGTGDTLLAPKLDFAGLGRIAGDVYQAVEQPVGIFCTLPVMR